MRKPFIILSQSPKDLKNDNNSHKLALPLASPQKPGIFRQKRQISSTPGTSPKELSRYRVTLGTQILGERLTLDQALKFATDGGES